MHAKAALLRPSWRALQLLMLTSVSLCIIVVYITTWGNIDSVTKYTAIPKLPKLPRPKFPSLTDVTKGITSGTGDAWDGVHPIDQLIKEAKQDFKRAVRTEAKSLEDAAKKYRMRRKRHPPPGFDAWYHFATERGAVIVEDFWDQIYHDLGPFWGVPPLTSRRQVQALSPKITTRNGNVTAQSKYQRGKLQQWRDMLSVLASQKHVKIPDVDIPLNMNDEPALVVPWETVDTALSIARPILPSSSDVLAVFSAFEDFEVANFTLDPEWLGPRLTHPSSTLGPRPYWSLVRPACHIKSPSRVYPILTDIWHPEGHTSEEHSAVTLLPTNFLNRTLQGFVRNWTIATEVCMYPHLQGLHGAFVAPESMGASQKLFPLFGAGKLSVNNDILIPGAAEWNSTESSSTVNLVKTLNWNDKENKLFWRGPATGGRNTAKNWQRFHRHRFVSMMNASQIAIAVASALILNATMPGVGPGQDFRVPPVNPYRVVAQNDERLAEWVDTWADVAFTDLHCDSLENDGNTCPYNWRYFSVAEPATPDVQEGYKYSAMLDGNGGDDAGEFIQRLKMGTVNLRASVYRNWYDSRLWPWLHYVPMDNTFMDVYGIMEYFLGTSTPEHSPAPVPNDVGFSPDDDTWLSEELEITKRNGQNGHDNEARHIAQYGMDWANKVLRKEDMLIYIYRLLLEYARIIDDSRERLGWVDDLIDQEGR